MMGKPLTLLFDPFESMCVHLKGTPHLFVLLTPAISAVFLAVITVNYAVADGKSNWLEGLLLMSGLYPLVRSA